MARREKRAKRARKAHERRLRMKWARAYCKVYGAPSPAAAAAWLDVGRKLAAIGRMPWGS